MSKYSLLCTPRRASRAAWLAASLAVAFAACAPLPPIASNAAAQSVIRLADGPLPVQKGLPETWDAISTGHLVIAQESLDHGWAEAVVTDRTDDLLTLRYRDYLKLPKFYRHYRAVALLSQPAG